MHSWPILAQLFPDIHLRLHLGHLYSPKHRFLPWYGVRPSPLGRACRNYVRFQFPIRSAAVVVAVGAVAAAAAVADVVAAAAAADAVAVAVNCLGTKCNPAEQLYESFEARVHVRVCHWCFDRLVSRSRISSTGHFLFSSREKDLARFLLSSFSAPSNLPLLFAQKNDLIGLTERLIEHERSRIPVELSGTMFKLRFLF